MTDAEKLAQLLAKDAIREVLYLYCHATDRADHAQLLACFHADAELDIDPSTSLTEAHRIAHEAEHTLTHAVPKLSSALVHAYPASPHLWRDPRRTRSYIHEQENLA